MIGPKTDCIKWLVDAPEGVYKVIEHRAKRSLTQNGYFHVLVGLMAAALRTSTTELKNRLIADYGYIDDELPHVILRDDIEWLKLDGLHLKPSTHVRKLDNGKLYRVYYVMRGTHTYNSAEMSRLIDMTVEEAKAAGVETLPPAELKRLREAAERRENDEQNKGDKHTAGGQKSRV